MENKSFKELNLSAQIGNPQAQFELAEKYMEGCGIFNLKNYKKALIWYQAAAEQGHAKAQVRLGEMFFNGKGVPIDCDQAYKWYKAAADQGYSGGFNNLATFYIGGLVVERNYEEGIRCFKKAALLGSSAACGMLALLYEKPWDGTPDYEESYFWNVLYMTGRSGVKESQSYNESIEQNLSSEQRAIIETKAAAWLQEHSIFIEE